MARRSVRLWASEATPERAIGAGATRDARFYSVARKVVHIEPGGIEALRGVYAMHFLRHATVLDLMSSWRSHLDSVEPSAWT